MSACISRDGEYGAHVPDGDWNCARCGCLDEEGLRTELARTTADLAVAVEVARERGEEIATWHQRLADVQAEYRTAAEYWDQQRERLKTEVGRLRAVAEAAAVLTGAPDDPAWRTLSAALDALDVGGEQS